MEGREPWRIERQRVGEQAQTEKREFHGFQKLKIYNRIVLDGFKIKLLMS